MLHMKTTQYKGLGNSMDLIIGGHKLYEGDDVVPLLEYLQLSDFGPDDLVPTDWEEDFYVFELGIGNLFMDDLCSQ